MLTEYLPVRHLAHRNFSPSYPGNLFIRNLTLNYPTTIRGSTRQSKCLNLTYRVIYIKQFYDFYINLSVIEIYLLASVVHLNHIIRCALKLIGSKIVT